MEDGNQKTPQTLAIRMFGEFSIRYGDRELAGNIGRSKKVWALVEYLLANRGKEIPLDRMMEELWPEEEYDNPFHILKNLVYRARMALKTLCGEDDVEFISFEHNCYTWNMSIPCRVDAELFDAYWQKSKTAADPDEKLEFARRAFEQYTGEFLPGLSHYSWVVSKSAYYASRYNQCVRMLAETLIASGKYAEAIRVCEVSIVFNPFEEEIHRLLLTAYARDGRHKMAVEHYQRISKQFYDEFGVTLSPETTELYKEIIKSMHNVEMDLAAIKEDLGEVSRLPGAYFCDYAIFKNIYRVNARVMARSGMPIHIGLITVTDSRGDVPDVETIKRVMGKLQTLVVEHLRRGDTVAMYSSTQLVLMLPQATRSNGCMVLDRLLNLFSSQYPMESVRIQYRLEAVDPVTN